ncbi:hypothetical protein D3C80_1867460 [compost metagenome]
MIPVVAVCALMTFAKPVKSVASDTVVEIVAAVALLPFRSKLTTPVKSRPLSSALFEATALTPVSVLTELTAAATSLAEPSTGIATEFLA